MKFTRAKGRFGFTLVELMIVVAIIGLLAAIAVPNLSRARTTAQRNSCISNLRVIDNAKEQWAFDKKKSVGASSRKSEINKYIKGGVAPKCPARGTYRYRPVGYEPACSIEDHALSTLLALGDDAADEE